jgi:hypothetical protein
MLRSHFALLAVQAPEDRPSFEEVIHDLRKMLEVQARSMEK